MKNYNSNVALKAPMKFQITEESVTVTNSSNVSTVKWQDAYKVQETGGGI